MRPIHSRQHEPFECDSVLLAAQLMPVLREFDLVHEVIETYAVSNAIFSLRKDAGQFRISGNLCF